MKIFTCIFTLSFITLSHTVLAQEGDETSYKPPEQHPISGAALPETVKKMFATYLPDQKPENCKWTYTEHEKQTEVKKGKKKTSVASKYRIYTNESPCTLKADDAKSPDVNFSMSGEDNQNPSVSVFSLNEKLLPAGVLDAAKALSTAGGEPQIGVDIGPGGKFAAIRFSFHQGLNFCTIVLDIKGKALKKPECGRGGYGGAE